uniref:Protein-glutamine gamma-glutamyltransferase 2 n=1 Tax=Mola mola TaxID=94237 RepID=A0A3Q3WSU3_MOLML
MAQNGVLCYLDIKSNSRSHHTDLYGEECLIVRRGQPFNIILHLKPGNGEFSPEETSLMFTVETGPLPQEESDTKVSFGIRESTLDTEWSASATNDPSRNTISVTINSSPNAPIGLYSLTLDQEGQNISLGQFILLFNAWCPRDAVYMRSETKRQEYVLARHGQIYRGTYKRINGTPWNFGQFDKGVLDICLMILDSNPKFVSDASKDSSSRRSPIYVTRVLSAMVGVSVGPLWAPVSGMLILQIITLKHFFWAVVMTCGSPPVARALGIPCRVVTNFESAHDADASLMIENVYDQDGKRISQGDSVWNFHVWVESWMTRPDLDSDFDGWQVSDPTPQETSEGVFCCGPAPVLAIHEGELTKKYDAPFIFAEVNADVVDMVRLPNGQLVKFGGSTKSVGRFISTKAVGSDDRRDITHQYKYPEGSKEERQVYKKAKHHNKLRQREEEPGLRLKIKLAKNMTEGSDFEVFAVLTNNGMEAKTCMFLFFATAVGYNGRAGEHCEKGFKNPINRVCVCGFSERRLSLKLEYEHYGSVIPSDRLIQLSAITFNKQAVEYYKAEKTIVLDEPEIEIKLLGEAQVNQALTVELTLLNPLPEALQDCSFTMDGVGLTDGKPITRKYANSITTVTEAKASIEFSPSSVGSTMLLVNFNSDKLKRIKSFINVVIKE